MFQCMKINEIIYEIVMEPSYKLLDQILTIMVTVIKMYEYPPHQKLTLIWINALSSATKGM